MFLLVGCLAACGDEGSPADAEPSAAPESHAAGPDADLDTPLADDAGLIVVLLDTLRLDRTSLYGFERDTTPFLRELAASSWVFDRAYAAASWTRASTASLFTGRLPAAHGCIDRSGLLVPSLTTLPEVLDAHGFDTRAVVSNPNVTAEYGFEQGFDSFHWAEPAEYFYADAAEFRGFVDEAFARPVDGRLFLYLHYMDPHGPYGHHADADFDPDYAGDIWGTNEDLSRYSREREELAGAHDERVRTLYDGEVLWVDRHLRALFDDQPEWLASHWLVVTSDHGEGLWTHGERSHGRDVYEEQIRVPLLVRPPGGLADGRRVPELISQVDLAPTLVELLGLPVPDGFLGRSWAPFLQRGEAAPERPVIIDQTLTNPRMGTEPARKIEMIGIVDGDEKLVIDRRTREVTFFDLGEDPAEQAGLAIDAVAEAPPRIGTLFRTLGGSIAAAARERPAEPTQGRDMSELDGEARDRMRALGYLGDAEGEDGSADGDG